MLRWPGFLLGFILFPQWWIHGKPFKVIATINIIADMAQQVGGRDVQVSSLLPAGTDPHTYEPTPNDAVQIAKADLVLINGLHLEGWLDKLIQSAGSAEKVATVSSLVKPIVAEGFQNSYDPHAWMTFDNACLYVKQIEEIFSRFLPQLKPAFRERAAVYTQKLREAEAQMHRMMQAIPEDKRFIITTHDAFRYFSRAYGFEVASIMGTSTDADISLKDINGLISIVKNHHVPSIFVEMAINPKVLQQLALDLHIQIGGKLFTDSFGPPGSEADNYIAMMLYNAKTISAALTLMEVHSVHNAWQKPMGLVLVILLTFLVAFIWVFRHIYPETNEVLTPGKFTLTIDNVSVMLGRKIILSNIYLQLSPGRLYGLLGANGSGKSTLVKTMVGLYQPLSGNIKIDGKPIRNFARKIAYLPQKEEFDMDFPVTVSDVVQLGFFPSLTGLGLLSSTQKTRAVDVMKQLEILHLADRQIAQLSGGQFQRTLLARALCQDAEIFILDEPFVGVDHATEEIIIQILKEIAKSGKLVIIIHHDLTKVRAYFDYLVMINQRIVASGPTEEVFTEENIKSTYSGKVTLWQKAMQLLEPQSR